MDFKIKLHSHEKVIFGKKKVNIAGHSWVMRLIVDLRAATKVRNFMEAYNLKTFC